MAIGPTSCDISSLKSITAIDSLVRFYFRFKTVTVPVFQIVADLVLTSYD